MRKPYGGVSRITKRPVKALLAIHDWDSFHQYLIVDALTTYANARTQAGLGLGSVLAVGANAHEASEFGAFPFESIVLAGIDDPDAATSAIIAEDPRFGYRHENGECMDLPSGTFDLTFCKEAAHHFARPVAGFYELLRLSRYAVVLIEPYDTAVGRLFERLGMASVSEVLQAEDEVTRDSIQLRCMNLGRNSNYVYRWNRRQLEMLLSSYYVDSGWSLDLKIGWMTGRLNCDSRAFVRAAATIAGRFASWWPWSPGNYMTAFIQIGRDLPPDMACLARNMSDS